MGGRFPVCCLHINVPLESFDINVHPAKSEIKFQHERAVFDTVYNAVRDALRQAGTESAPPIRITPYAPSGGRLPVLSPAPPSAYRASVMPENTLNNDGYAGAYTVRPREIDNRIDIPDDSQQAVPAWRLIGEAMAGYLLVETPEALWIIDKHAAHERLLFNRLKAEERPFMSQRLLTARVVILSQPEMDILLQEQSFLEETGFEIDVSNPGALTVRAAPGEVDEGDIPALLSEIASLLLSGRRPDIRQGALQAVACKAAIKLGRSSRREDIEHLAGLVMETPELRHCPHGRPVAMRLTRGDLGRQFGR
jgi:DNA mismatch repair protein MutL